MKSFQEECALLEPLQTFDPAAFEGDENVPQRLCNLVLALALIYNDCKNITYAALVLRDSKPPGKHELNPTWGTWSGTEWHLFRLMISAVHELLTLLQNHQDMLTHEFLIKVVKQLPSTSRRSWDSLIVAASGATPKDDFGQMTLRIRNQMVFHYDPKGIFAGFKRHLLIPTRLQDRAYISRGLSMEASRFYFADAAVEGYFREMVGLNDEVGQLSMKVRDVVDSLNFALLSLVDRFIQQRGFAYRKV
jgi:hypothetical protein